MMAKLTFSYYLITDRFACSPHSLAEVVEQACRAGIRAVQLREKDLKGRALYELATEMREITSQFEAKLYINGRPDIAQAVNADGVHCREMGIGPAEIRQFWPDLSAGASVHSVAAAKKAEQQGADFLLFGPIYFTPSKASYGGPQGIEKLEKLASEISIPIFAVGGISLDRAEACLKAGAYGVAGISAVMKADDISKTVEQFEKQLHHH